MTRVRIQEPSGRIGPSQISRCLLPRKPHGARLQLTGTGLGLALEYGAMAVASVTSTATQSGTDKSRILSRVSNHSLAVA